MTILNLFFVTALTNNQLYKPPLEPKMTPAFSQLISAKTPDVKVKIWVFYTDKGITDSKRYKDVLEELEKSLPQRVRENRLIIKNPGELCDFSDIPVNKTYIEELKAMGCIITGNSKWLNASAVVTPIKLIPQIADKKYVHKIDIVRTSKTKVEPEYTPKTTKGGIDYGDSKKQLEIINIPKVHSAGYTGEGVVIGILDAGFEWRKNKALEGVDVIAEYDFIGKDDTVSHQEIQVDTIWRGSDTFILPEQGLYEEIKHGSAMLCLMGGRNSNTYVGSAFNASFALARTELVWSTEQYKDFIAEESWWIQGAEWLADEIGVSIISSSLGYKDWTNDYPAYAYDSLDGKHYPIEICASMLYTKNVLLVTAMGNLDVISPDTIVAPGTADSILTVGGVDTLGNWAPGSLVGPRADGAIKPEVCGPWMANYGYPRNFPAYDSLEPMTGAGTSDATAIVAGACACIKEGHPDWSAMKIREAVIKTASRANAPNDTVGYGIMNAYDAIFYNGETPVIKIPYNKNKILSLSKAPFRPETDEKLIFNYQVVNTSFVRVYVYSLSGKLVWEQPLGKKQIGRYSFEWNGKSNGDNFVNSGIYICLLVSTDIGDKDVKKFAVVR